MHADIADFIERMGLLWEEEGLTRIAGRIFALAFVSPDPCSLDQIADTLRVSKPSVSNDARMLHRMGLIERVSFPGDRKDYYQITRDSIERGFQTRLNRLRAFENLTSSAATLPIRNKEVHRRIEAHLMANRAIIEAFEDVIDTLKTQLPTPARSRRA